MSDKKRTMNRIDGESKIAHRAFLLWAMQNPKKRNQRATGRAVERSTTTIRGHMARWFWEDRASDITSDQVAQGLYRELYFEEFGSKEIAMVKKNIISPISVLGTMPATVAAGIRQTLEQTDKPKETVFTNEIKRRHIDLIDYAIRYITQALQNGDIRATLKDIPTLVGLRRELTGEGASEQKQAFVVETMRVKDAKANGHDIVEAMLEDSKELVSIFESLTLRTKAPQMEIVEDGR